MSLQNLALTNLKSCLVDCHLCNKTIEQAAIVDGIPQCIDCTKLRGTMGIKYHPAFSRIAGMPATVCARLMEQFPDVAVQPFNVGAVVPSREQQEATTIAFLKTPRGREVIERLGLSCAQPNGTDADDDMDDDLFLQLSQSSQTVASDDIFSKTNTPELNMFLNSLDVIIFRELVNYPQINRYRYFLKRSGARVFTWPNLNGKSVDGSRKTIIVADEPSSQELIDQLKGLSDQFRSPVVESPYLLTLLVAGDFRCCDAHLISDTTEDQLLEWGFPEPIVYFTMAIHAGYEPD